MPSGPTFWIILAAATLAASGGAFLEWRRADRRHVATRLAATVVAVAALTLLGLHPNWQYAPPAPGGVRAALWTPFASGTAPAVPAGIDAGHRFALPDAARLDPAAQPVTDAASLRRRFPEIGTVRLLGDGLDASELDALRGLRVEFDPADPPASPPGIRFLSCPRELHLGNPLVLQGRLGGLVPHTSVTLTLDAPDGTTVNVTTLPADATGEACFTLQTTSPPAAGHFLWHLRLPAAADHPATDLPLGVAIQPPDLPRVLILESAPRFDTAALRRWFESAGGTLITRTQVGQDRYRYAAATSTPPSFAVLNAPFLTGFDLLLADSRSLLALSPTERDILLASVADTGLGVLLLPDDASPPTAATPLFPWKLSPLASDPPGGDRPARLQWPGQSVPTDLPIPAAPFEILPADTQRPLLGDRQGHTLAATMAHGRGQIALTLVRDTTRWQRENDPAAFAAYWSFLFSQLARSATDAANGQWSLSDGDAGPVFADHPLELRWSGPANRPPGPAGVLSSPSPDSTPLTLAPDPAEPGRWRGTFWPRHPGWHHVSLASGGPALDFYVSIADVWSALAAERRRTATARFAGTTIASPSFPSLPLIRKEFPPFWLAAIFFLSAGYLWIERRFAR